MSETRQLKRLRGRIHNARAKTVQLAKDEALARKALATLRQRYAKLRGAGGDTPKIVAGVVAVQSKFGALGPEQYVTGHHTAGPKDTSLAHAISLCKSYNVAHARQGWGGIGYHFCIARTGELICLRPTYMKGAHVGGWNSNNVGVVCHGTTGDKPTAAQERTYKWLIQNAHTSALPKAHRTDLPLTRAKRYGHNDWSGHETNACPGTHKPMYVGR